LKEITTHVLYKNGHNSRDMTYGLPEIRELTFDWRIVVSLFLATFNCFGSVFRWAFRNDME